MVRLKKYKLLRGEIDSGSLLLPEMILFLITGIIQGHTGQPSEYICTISEQPLQAETSKILESITHLRTFSNDLCRFTADLYSSYCGI